MPICQSGHTSAADDFCDVCGELIAGASRVEYAPAPVSAPVSEDKDERCPRCGTTRSGRFCEVDGYDFETGAAPAPAEPAAKPAPAPAEATPTPGLAEAAPPPGPPEAAPAPAPAEAALAPTPAEASSEPVSAEAGRAAASPTGWTAVIAADRAYFDSVIALSGPDAGSLKFPPYCPERRVVLAGRQVRIGRRSVSRALLPEIDLGVPPEDPGVSHVHAVLLAQPDGTWVLVDPGSTNGTSLNGATEPIAVNVPVPVADGDRIHVGAWTTITLSQQGEGPS